MTTSLLLRIFLLRKILQEPPTTSWACGPTAAFASRKQQSNAMPSQNLLSGHHHCPTHGTSTYCSKGCFSPHSSKQQTFPKPTQTFPMVKNQSYMGNFYVGLVCGCQWGLSLDPRGKSFWVTSPINAFHGAPLHLSIWITRTRFEAILSALPFTDIPSPTFIDKFWEVQQMIEAWGMNMKDNFIPGYMNCLDESMSMLTNKFTCPGIMFIPCKPWPFGNKYHTICCYLSGIM